jgi:hypothetical protein
VNYHTLADFRVEKQQELDELFTQVLAALTGWLTYRWKISLSFCRSAVRFFSLGTY